MEQTSNQGIQFLRFFRGTSRCNSIEIKIEKGYILISHYYGYYKELFALPNLKVSHANEKILLDILEEFKDWKNDIHDPDTENCKEWELELKFAGDHQYYSLFGFEDNEKNKISMFESSKKLTKLLTAFNQITKSNSFSID